MAPATRLSLYRHSYNPHHKQTGATDSYLELYEKYPETKELVTHRYRQDIEYLGYDFE